MIKLFESFKEIEDICQKYGIENYTINRNGSIDVNDDVDLSNTGFIKLPLKFNRVTGDFRCHCNHLKTLEGAPNKVDGSFFCQFNKLTSLEGAPKKVGDEFSCSWNELTSLEGAPKEISRSFYCYRNLLTSLEGSPQYINNGFYCDYNNIQTFEGAPDYIKYFNCDNNLIYEIWKLFEDYSKVELFNYYDIIREVKGKPAIVLDRLNEKKDLAFKMTRILLYYMVYIKK